MEVLESHKGAETMPGKQCRPSAKKKKKSRKSFTLFSEAVSHVPF